MRVDDMQLGTQIPNSVHSMPINRPEQMESDGERKKAIEAQLLPSGVLGSIQQISEEEDRMNARNRPVIGVENDPMRQDENPQENAPGNLLDLMA